ncbi:MAG TPA: DUF2007 domain-containing protein [Gammaproteobacteria bacterium]|nr:DUF2007 domain-containing protein [Gammaproteobacteria bacterium]
MLKVYEAALVYDAEQVRDLLLRRGIDAYVFGEHTYNVLGVNPLAWPQVWVAEDEDFERAKALIGDYEKAQRAMAASAAAGKRWRCRACGETNEGTFDVCWSCGEPRGG